MKGYRSIYRCPECKKVGRNIKSITNDFNTFSLVLNDTAICKHCGEKVKFERVAAKPKLFGLFGWSVKE